jgi:hypothetical protein
MKDTMDFKAPRLGLLVLLLASYAFAKEKEPVVLTLQGEVEDSQCAYNVHSRDRTHDSMIKKNVYGRDAKSCTLHCVKEMGGNFVLVVKDEVYRLDGPVKLEEFAGKKVKVSAKLDPKTQTLHVLTMEAER